MCSSEYLANDSYYFTVWENLRGGSRVLDSKPQGREHRTENQKSGLRPVLLLSSCVSLDQSLDPHMVGRTTSHSVEVVTRGKESTAVKGCCKSGLISQTHRMFE